MSELPPQRETMEFDVVIVGAGPAGLAAAIRIRQAAAKNERDISVVVVEKGSEVGAHILSGVVVDPIGLDSLLPDWRSHPIAHCTPACRKTVFSTHSNRRAPPARRHDAETDRQSWQFHWIAGQCHPLSGRPRRRTGRGNISRFCRF
jgi:choline dehydrogenase-like flavoprotein